jgi:hypothetical protein
MEGGDISMSTVDERVVNMRFNNSQFESGVKSTIASLDNLAKKLSMQGTTKGLADVSNSAKNTAPALSGMASGVENISSKFNALHAIGFTVIQSLTNTAMGLGQKVLGGILDPLIAGGKQRALTIEQAKFQFKGLGMSVADTMASAKAAVLGTSYGLADAAKAASMFGASGMRAGPAMVSSLRAIAGVAAMTGSAYSDISDVFTSVSGNGRLMGSDLLRLSARGVNAAATLSKSLGKPESVIRDMVTSGDISFKMFSDAMDQAFGKHAADANQTFMGSLANMKAALSRTGADVATPSYEAMRKVLNAITPVIDNIHKALMPVIDAFGKFVNLNADKVVGSLKGLNFSGLSKSIPSILNSIKNIFVAIQTAFAPIKNAFQEIFPPGAKKPIEDIAKSIQNFTARLKMGETTANNVRRTFAGIFAIFDIGRQIVQKLVGMFGELFGSTGVSSGGILNFTGNIGDFLVKIDQAIKRGQGLTKFFDTLKTILLVPIGLIKAFGTYLMSAFDGVKGLDTSGFGALGGKIQSGFAPLAKLGNMITSVWTKVGTAFKAVWNFFAPLASALATEFKNIATKITDAVKTLSPQDITSMINTGLFAGLVLILKNFTNRVTGLFTGQSKFTLISSMKASLSMLTQSLRVMQGVLKAQTLLMIAAAIGILAISVVALSRIDPKKLATSLLAMGIMFKELDAAGAALQVMAKRGDSGKMLIIAGAMILMAIAVDVLASAVKKLADLNWSQLSKGLIGVTVLLGAMSGAVRLMGTNTGRMISTGAGLMLLAVGIRILVGAVTNLSGLSWGQMTKGLVGVGALLTELTLFTKFSEANKGGLAQGAGLILLAVGIKILASAMTTFASFSWEQIARGLVGMGGGLALMTAALMLIPPSSILSAAAVLVVAASLGMIATALGTMGGMSWEVIGKGLVSMAGAMTLIAAALILIPPTSLLSAAAVLVVAASLGMIATALGTMGGMSWEAIGKGLIVLAGSLGIIALALYAMEGGLLGAAALVVVAGSLRILLPVIQAFAGMSWEEIGKGLAMLAGIFVILGVAGLLLTPVIPTLLGLGIAIGLIGAAVMMAGVGILLFSIGLTAISVAGAAATVAIVGIVAGLIGLIPMVIKEIGIGLVLFAQVIATSGPAIMMAMTAVLMAIIGTINTVAPAIISSFVRIVMMILAALVVLSPALVAAGFKMLMDLLTGIQNNIGQIVTTVGNIIVNFLNALASRLPSIITAGVNVIVAFLSGIGNPSNIKKLLDAAANTIVNFVNGLSQAIDAHAEDIGRAAGKLAVSLAKGLVHGLGGAIREVSKSIGGWGGAIIGKLADAFGVKSPSRKTYAFGINLGKGLSNGLNSYSSLASKSAAGVGNAAIDSMRKSISGMSDLVTGPIDIQPTIKPVMDLTDVHQGAGVIGSLLSAQQQIPVGTAYSNNVSTGYSEKQAALAVPGTFVQSQAKMLKDNIQAMTLAIASKPVNVKDQTSSPRPVEFHIGTIQDGDSLLRRARANDQMLSLAEGGDSPQIVGIGL